MSDFVASSSGSDAENNLSLISKDGPAVKDGSFTVIPQFTIGLSSLGASGLQSIANNVPWIDYSDGYLRLNTPGLAGYNIQGEIHGDVTLGASLDYHFDFGHMDSQATVTDHALEGSGGKNAQLFNDYILNTYDLDFKVAVHSVGPQTASTVDLNVTTIVDAGVKDFGLYDDGDGIWTTNALYLDHKDYGKTISILNIDPNDPQATQTLDEGPLTGFVTVPKLPDLDVTAEGTGPNAKTPANNSGDGPTFASINLDPIPFIPVLGEINAGNVGFESWAVDAGVDYKLITAEIGLEAALKQDLTVNITDVGISTVVKEVAGTDANGNTVYVDKTPVDGHLGEQIDIPFSQGDHYNTVLDETFSITAHIDSKLGIDFKGHVDLGLLHLSAYINPVFIDEIRETFDLFSTTIPFNIGSIDITDTGYDVHFDPITLTKIVDTHSPVAGSDLGDALTLALNQVAVDGKGGDDTIEGNGSDNDIRGGADNDWVSGGDGNDTIDGGAGNDTITGGAGNDILTGGSGADTFVFSTAAGNGFDTIRDFVHGVDALVFAHADYGLAAGHGLTAAEFTVGDTAVGASAQFIWNDVTHVLSFDHDGAGGDAAIAIAGFTGAVTVTADDLHFS